MAENDDDAIADSATRDLIYDRLKDAPERQLADNNDLDGKAATLFGAASVVMGLVSFGSLGGNSKGQIAGAITTLLIGAGISYVITVVAALVHLWPVDQERTVFAKTLQTNFKDRKPAELQEWIIRQAAQAWEFNENVTKRKGRTLEWIAGGLGAEVILVVIALIVSRFG